MITSIIGTVTQPWKNAKAGHHVSALGKITRRDISLLRKRGLIPFLVSWYNVMTGDPKDLRCDKPGWNTRVVFAKALQGIYFEAKEIACYMEVASGFVWKVQRQGCGVIKVGHPITAQALLKELEGRTLTPP